MHTSSWTPPVWKVFWAVFLTQHLHKTPSTWWLHFCYLRGAKHISSYCWNNTSLKNAVQNNCVVLVRNQYWKLVIMYYSSLNKEVKKKKKKYGNPGHLMTIYFGGNFWATAISLAALWTLPLGKNIAFLLNLLFLKEWRFVERGRSTTTFSQTLYSQSMIVVAGASWDKWQTEQLK